MDMQAGKAFLAAEIWLCFVNDGRNGYFTYFQHIHQLLKRINKVQNIKIQDRIIGTRFVDILSNYFSLMLLLIICLYFAKQAKIDLLLRYYIKHQMKLTDMFPEFGK